MRCSVGSCVHRFVLSRSLRQRGGRRHSLHVGLQAKLQRRTAQELGILAHRLDDREARRIAVHQGVAHAPTPRLEHLALGRVSIHQCGVCGVIADASEHALNPRPFRLDATERHQIVRSVRDEQDPGLLRIAGKPLASQLGEQLLSPSVTKQAHMHGALNVSKPPRVRPPLAEQIESGIRIQRGVGSDVLDHPVREWDHATDVRFGWFAEGHVAAERMVRGRLHLERGGQEPWELLASERFCDSRPVLFGCIGGDPGAVVVVRKARLAPGDHEAGGSGLTTSQDAVLREMRADAASVVDRHVQDGVDNIDGTRHGAGGGRLSEINPDEAVDIRLLIYSGRDLEEVAVLQQFPELRLVLERLTLGPRIGHCPVRNP